jgi:hypothetical protein
VQADQRSGTRALLVINPRARSGLSSVDPAIELLSDAGFEVRETRIADDDTISDVSAGRPQRSTS